MRIYEELSYNLGECKEYYRFQGGHSQDNICFDHGKHFIDKSRYLYVSKGIKHHKYFMDKRIKQIVDEIAFNGTPTLTTGKYKRRKSDISEAIRFLQSKAIDISTESLRIKFLPIFHDIVTQNCIPSPAKPSGASFIEIVDTKQGTGYGFADEWTELFNNIIILVVKKKLTTRDIIEYLKILKQNGGSKTTLLDPSIIINNGHLNYSINPNLHSDFSKYAIIELLENILDKGLVNDNSDLAMHPTETIKNVVREYQEERVKVMKMLDSISKRKLDFN